MQEEEEERRPLWRINSSATKGPGLACRPSKASTSMRASSWWSISVFLLSTRLRADSQVGYGGFTGRCWAGASAWEHTPLASSASEEGGLGGGIGRKARTG